MDLQDKVSKGLVVKDVEKIINKDTYIICKKEMNAQIIILLRKDAESEAFQGY